MEDKVIELINKIEILHTVGAIGYSTYKELISHAREMQMEVK